MSNGDIWDSSEDSMTYDGQAVALTCVKCRQTGERTVQYCGPDQRGWNYDEVPPVPHVAARRWGRLIWKAKRTTTDTKQCPLDGEHFHLHCIHCQFKWTEPLPVE